MNYQVKFYTGDYKRRQRAANADRCKLYVEHHFNASVSPDAAYAVVIVGSNASVTSKQIGRFYADAIGDEFNVSLGGDDGIIVGGYGGRGDGNIRYTAMPAVLLEPLFCSNPCHAEIIKSELGQIRLASVLAQTIRTYFPAGGLIGFSVGHKYRHARPHDKGAAVFGGGHEADYAECVLQRCQQILTQ